MLVMIDKLFDYHENFATHLAEATEDRPFDVLISQIEADENRPGLELSFVPLDEGDDLAGHQMLQFFQMIDLEPAKSDRTKLQRKLHELNAQSPLVGYGYSAEADIWFFRHIAIVPEAGEGAVGMAVQTNWMINYLLELFAPELEPFMGK